MKHSIGIGFLLVLALMVRFGAFKDAGLDIYVHDTYRVIQMRIVGFWLLILMASAWTLIAAFKSVRHGS